MKKILLGLLIVSAILAFLSMAYYFAVFLPHQQLENQASFDKIRKEIKNGRPEQIDTSKIESQLDELDYALQRQNRERQMQIDCESNNGRYVGSGTCVYY